MELTTSSSNAPRQRLAHICGWSSRKSGHASSLTSVPPGTQVELKRNRVSPLKCNEHGITIWQGHTTLYGLLPSVHFAIVETKLSSTKSTFLSISINTIG